jgi:hypothetical protein
LVKVLEVTVRNPDGIVVRRIALNEDLFDELLRRMNGKDGIDMGTVWFFRILQALFALTPSGIRSSASYVDTGGVSRTQNFKDVMYPYGTTSPDLSNFFNTGRCANRLWIGYGSSSVSPTRTNFRLGNKLDEGLASITVNESLGVITLSVSFTVGSDTTIYEVGLEWEATVSSFNVCGRVLLDRTVFPDGIFVGAGQTVTFVYRFIFP